MIPSAKAAWDESYIDPDEGFNLHKYPIWAGQHIYVGDLNVFQRDDGTIHIQYWMTVEGWELLGTHLAVGDDLSDIPQTKKGNPIPGQFQYKVPDLPTEYYWEFIIPDTFADGATLYIAAHANVMYTDACGCCVQCETAWASMGCCACPTHDFQFEGKNWATYITYVLEEPPTLDE